MARTESVVIGDVHGCAEELDELLEILLEDDPTRTIRLVGDLLTKGPDPGGVVDAIEGARRLGVDIHSVCGNHDLSLHHALAATRGRATPHDLRPRDRETIARLGDPRRHAAALALLDETVARTISRAGPATVVHAGIDPRRGLEGTTPHELVHLKAAAGETPWWERYDGRDGLIVFGHKPASRPIRATRSDAPIAVNVDTGCVLGGRLTAYLVERDEFISVESRQVPRRNRFARTDDGGTGHVGTPLAG